MESFREKYPKVWEVLDIDLTQSIDCLEKAIFSGKKQEIEKLYKILLAKLKYSSSILDPKMLDIIKSFFDKRIGKIEFDNDNEMG